MNNVAQNQNPCDVTILVLPESSMMCVASVLEPLRAANRVAGKTLYHWQLTSLDGAPIMMTCGTPLMIDRAFDSNHRGDLLVIVAGFNQMVHVTTYALAKIRNAIPEFTCVAGVEAGSWILARSGMLSGKSATTHWEDFEAFAEAFSDIEVKTDRYVLDGKWMTCGGASPAFDMFLDFIRKRNGPAIAMEAASVFIYDEAHSQFDAQPLVSLGKRESQDPRLERAVRMMEKWIEQPLPVAAIAKRVNVTSKTLETIFKADTGMTPGKFYLNLRLKAASRMVRDTKISLREIAIRSGFNSLSAFSRAFAKEFGSPPRKTRLLAKS